tara:strand:+ start:1015 stop:1296 length:282 start_codon:yes stop_codon:yes gene_type:complete
MSIERTVTGTVATVFTITMKLPQIYHSIKTRRTKDISMLFLLLGVLNHITWVLYAIFDDVNIPLIVCDAVCIFLSLVLVILKLKYDKVNDIVQ